MGRPERTLVIPDVHVPYHDKVAFRCMLKAAKAMKPDNIVIIGDFPDFYAVSAHPKPPSRRANFPWEIEQTNKALDLVDALNPPNRKEYVMGNHEYRMDRFIRDKAPELYGLKGTTVVEQLGLRKRGWNVTPFNDYIRLGKVAYTHTLGHFGATAITQTLRSFGGNIVIGDIHRGGVNYQGTVKDGGRFCMAVGWLGDVKSVDYKHLARAERDWEHGFGIVDTDERGIGWPQFVPIIYGKCIVDRQEFTGRAA